MTFAIVRVILSLPLGVIPGLVRTKNVLFFRGLAYDQAKK
jgi:hypothetical protein